MFFQNQSCRIDALNLSNNSDIGDVDTSTLLRAALRVKILDLSSCGLTSSALTDSLQQLFVGNSVLSQLDLSDNSISSIPIEAVKVHRSEIALNLRSNPAMTFPPREIAEGGPEEVSRFFAELRDGCLPVASVNVLLVGDGGVGKTTLKVKALLGKEPLAAGNFG